MEQFIDLLDASLERGQEQAAKKELEMKKEIEVYQAAALKQIREVNSRNYMYVGQIESRNASHQMAIPTTCTIFITLFFNIFNVFNAIFNIIRVALILYRYSDSMLVSPTAIFVVSVGLGGFEVHTEYSASSAALGKGCQRTFAMTVIHNGTWSGIQAA